MLAHNANPDDPLKLISLSPRPDIFFNAETKYVELEPGGKVEVTVSVKRNNDFSGRVPVEVRNLPPGVVVTGVAVNGVLLNETEERRTFTLEALSTTQPLDQQIFVSGNVETRAAGQQNSFAAEPIVLKVNKLSAAGDQPSAVSAAGSHKR